MDQLLEHIGVKEGLQTITPDYRTPDTALYNNDCLEIMSRFPDDSVDMIFADPPYNLSNDGVTCQSGKMVSVNKAEWDKSEGFDKDFEFHEKWISECKRILKPGGTIWISGTNHSIYQCGYLLQKLNFHILNDISWFKPNASPNLACNTFAHSHETLIWAKKDKQAKHIFNYDIMKNGAFNGDKIKKPGKQMRSVWSIPPPSSKEKTFGKYPTQKPLALLTRIILASTNESSLILDPFNGSGTTALAAKITGRRYIGIDTGKECINLTVERLLNSACMIDGLWNQISLDIANVDRYWLTASDALDRISSGKPAGNAKPVEIMIPELKELVETGVMKQLRTATCENYKKLTVDDVEDFLASLPRNDK